MFLKDPDAVLDYEVDWSAWLGTDTISAVAWTVPTGITQNAVSNTPTTATIWIAGGTKGISYEVSCEITTAGGRTAKRSFVIEIVSR